MISQNKVNIECMNKSYIFAYEDIINYYDNSIMSTSASLTLWYLFKLIYLLCIFVYII